MDSLIRDLVEIRDKIDSIIETLEIMSDKELMESIRRSEEDIKKGKVRDFEEFLKEIGVEI